MNAATVHIAIVVHMNFNLMMDIIVVFRLMNLVKTKTKIM